MRATKKLVAVLACLIMVSVPMMAASDLVFSNDSVGKLGYATIIYDNKETQDVEKTILTDFVVKTPDPRPGYDFQYWDFDGKHVSPGKHNYFEYSGYASDLWYFNSVWKGKEYQAKFMDGNDLVESKTCVYGEKIGQLPTFSKAGYEFLGWSPTGSSTDIINSDTVYSTVGTQEFKAVLKANVYNVSLLDGDKLVDVKECTYNQPYGKLPVLSKDGYIFKGWALDKSGVNMIDENTKYLKAEDSSIYAIWVAKKFTITFDDGGITVGTKTVDFNSKIGEMPVPNKPGYTFLGWSTDGTEGAIIGPDTVFTYLNDITLHSVWKANTYKISFMVDGSPMSTKDVTFGQQIGDMPSPTKTGYAFLGWSTDGTEQNIVNSQTIYDHPNDIELFAVWSANTYKISFKVDGSEIADKDVRYGSKIGAMPAPTKVGKTFAGWVDANGRIVTSDTTYDWDADIALDATWSEVGYELKFISEGKEISMKRVNYGMEIGEMPVAVSKGKTFVGWSVDESESGIVTPQTKYEFEGNGRLYAVFHENNYTVTFDSNGGKTTPQPIQCKYGQHFGTLPTVEKDGKRFLGWSMTQDGSSMVTSETVLEQDSDITLDAIWGDEILSPSESIFDNPVSVVVLVSAILATIGLSVWIYRKGLI